MGEPERGDVPDRLVRAATVLLAEQPASMVTVRKIAARAGVHHSMIHRHFGSKDALMLEALAGLSMRYCEAVASIPVTEANPSAGFLSAFEHIVRDPNAGANAFASTLLHGGGRAPVQRFFPGVDLHVAQLRARLGDHTPHRDPRLLTVGAIAFVGGWSLLEDWAMRAGDLEGLGLDEVRRQVAEILDEMVRAQLAVAPPPRSR